MAKQPARNLSHRQHSHGKRACQPQSHRHQPVRSAFLRRSACPLNASVEMLGDRWSLLILRDMMLRGFKSYKEFLNSNEGIATNILADRLKSLLGDGIISARPDPSDGRKLVYALTEKGIDLAPMMAEMVLWAARHEKTGNQQLVRQLQKDKQRMIEEVRQRWLTETE